MKFSINYLALTVSVFFSLMFATASAIAAQDNLAGFTVMALGPADGRAVVTLPDGKMKVVKVGDSLPGSKATVIQVLPDKLVLEEIVENPGTSPVKQTIWLYKPSKAGGKSRIQRLDTHGPIKGMNEKSSNVMTIPVK